MNEAEAQAGKGRMWPVMVVGLLSLNIAVCAVTVTMAIKHPAPVEDNYYDKALRWDEHRAAQAAADDTAREAARTP